MENIQTPLFSNSVENLGNNLELEDEKKPRTEHPISLEKLPSFEKLSIKAQIINAQNLFDLIDKTPLLLDLRPADDFKLCHLDNSFSINFPPLWLKRAKKRIVKDFQMLQFWEQNQTFYDKWSLMPDRIAVVYEKSADFNSDVYNFAEMIASGFGNFDATVYVVKDGFQEIQQSSLFESILVKAKTELSIKNSKLAALGIKLSPLSITPSQSGVETPADFLDFKTNDDNCEDNSAIPDRPYSEITPNLFIGSDELPTSPDAVSRLSELGVSHILNMAAEVKNSPELQDCGKFQNCWIPVYDNTEQDMEKAFEDSINFIENAIKYYPNAKVFVHCKAGRSRSVSVVLGYLIKVEKYTLNYAYKHVKKCRTGVSPNLGFMASLLKVELETHGENTGLY